MKSTVLSFQLIGLSPRPIIVEVENCGVIPGRLQFAGMSDVGGRECRVRVRVALLNVGVELDDYDIAVTIVPAMGVGAAGLDLAIALAVLAAIGRIPSHMLDGTAVLGELSLTGAIKHVRGVLPILLGAAEHGARAVIVPRDNEAEAAQADMVTMVATDLAQVVAHLGADSRPLPLAQKRPVAVTPADVDLSDLRGHHAARRALEVAATGNHNLLLIGPPGCGKTMAARMLGTILPAMTHEEALEVTALHSAAGLVPSSGLVTQRPFRAPHNTVSVAGLLGGGSPIRPGEITLAHRGVLFLDDIAEFRKGALESLRPAIEADEVTLSRGGERSTLPAKPFIVAAMNPCPCGYHGDLSHECVCSPERVKAYRARIAPVLDLFDIRATLAPVTIHELTKSPSGEPSADVRRRVTLARVSAMRSRPALDTVAAGADLLSRAASRLGMSAKAANRALRVARTIADLDGSALIHAAHVAEAIQMRAAT